jgi:hypothetical protein
MNWSKAKASRGIVFLLVFSLLLLYPVCTVFSQTSSGTTVAVKPSTNTARVGETVTINITLTNVQNLYALDVTLQWNASALQVLSADARLGVESHSDGVLHNEIQVVEDNASQEIGQYHLVATSIAPAASFTGSGIIAIIVFNVTSLGHSELVLATELADYNPAGSNFIDHTDINGTVDSVIPEFPNIAVFALFLLLATFVVFASKKLLKKNVTHAIVAC